MSTWQSGVPIDDSYWRAVPMRIRIFFLFVLCDGFLLVFGRSYRRVEVKGGESECVYGTCVRALSHKISIQNALRALVPKDYTPGAMNLPLRGRLEIATFSSRAPFRKLSFTAPAVTRWRRANETVADFSATSWKCDHVPASNGENGEFLG